MSKGFGTILRVLYDGLVGSIVTKMHGTVVFELIGGLRSGFVGCHEDRVSPWHGVLAYTLYNGANRAQLTYKSHGCISLDVQGIYM